MVAPEEKSFCVLEYHTRNYVVNVQRAFRAKYVKYPPTDKTIRAWYKQVFETGCLCKQKSSGRLLTLKMTLNGFVLPVVHTSKLSSCKFFFQFSCGF
jgi:hypothetical protein